MQVHLHDQELDYTFERQQYAWVQLNGETSEQVIFIHNILQHTGESDFSHALLVTIYTPLGSTFPFNTLPARGTTKPSNELVLHFGDSDFYKMGTAEEAQLILLADISSARLIGYGRTTIRHVVQHVSCTLSLPVSVVFSNSAPKRIMKNSSAALAFAIQSQKVSLHLHLWHLIYLRMARQLGKPLSFAALRCRWHSS